MNEWVVKVTKVIYIHPLTWGVLALSLVTAQMKWVLLAYVIVVLHELGHAVVAKYYKWRIKRIQLLPFGGVLETEEPWGTHSARSELLVILAGPFVNVLLFFVFLVGHYTFFSEEMYMYMQTMNVLMLVINLLPLWPLDGGKLLFNYLSVQKPFVQAYVDTIKFSIIGVALLGCYTILFMPGQLTFWMLISFIGYHLYFDWQKRGTVFIQFILERYYGKKQDFQKLKKLTFHGTLPIYRTFSSFYRGCKHVISVESDIQGTFTCDENELLFAYFNEQPTMALQDIRNIQNIQ